MLTRCSEIKLKILEENFYQSTMKGIKIYEKKYTCVITLVIFYETKTKYPRNFNKVLSCVLYSDLENFFTLTICVVIPKH